MGLVGTLSAGPTVVKEKGPGPDFTGVKLVFCAACSFNKKGDWANKGYLQSLPGFLIQLILENQKILSQMRIVLIDPCWAVETCGSDFTKADGGYDKSDLKRYLDLLPDGLGKKIEDQIYLVPENWRYWADYARHKNPVKLFSPEWVVQKLIDVVENGGIVFLADLDTSKSNEAHMILYNILRDKAERKENIQYTNPDWAATPVAWFGTYQYNPILFAMLRYRGDFFQKSVLNKNVPFDAAKSAFEKYIDLRISEAVKVLGKVGSPYPGYYESLVGIDKIQVFSVADNKDVLLTKDFFMSAPLPYMLVSNDPGNTYFPLLEYELDAKTDPKKWKLIHKLNCRDYQWKHLGVPGDPLGDALKNFSASLEDLGMRLRRA
jgi:hypothetical protein